jgi:hypothetical protein
MHFRRLDKLHICSCCNFLTVRETIAAQGRFVRLVLDARACQQAQPRTAGIAAVLY